MQSETSRLYGKTMTSPIPNRTVYTVRQPMGICAAIMPFNSPAGRRGLEGLPRAGLRQRRGRQVARADPVHRRRVRTTAAGSGPAARRVLGGARPRPRGRRCRSSTDARVGLVSFTGSVATGKLIQKTVSERPVLAKVCLELGGKNPLVVCDDADLGLAAELAVASAFIDAGQRCAVGQPHHRVRSRLRRVLRRDAEVRGGDDAWDRVRATIADRSSPGRASTGWSRRSTPLSRAARGCWPVVTRSIRSRPATT